MAERYDEILRVLLDGAIDADDRQTLIRLHDQAFGKPAETVQSRTLEDEVADLSEQEIDDLLAQLKHLPETDPDVQ